jgi:hypothetical protein
MLLAIPGFGVTSLGLIIALSLLTYAIGSGLTKGATDSGNPKRRLAAGAGVVSVLAFLSFFKYGPVQGLFLPSQASREPTRSTWSG